MIPIANRKIEGLEPRWASFRGFSLLFDNPGSSFLPMNESAQEKLSKINCCVDKNPELRLYKGFTEALSEIGKDLLSNTYLFCPLPSYSYHVTVWDGLNDDNVQNAGDNHRPKLENLLESLPHALLTDKTFTREIYDSPLITRKDWSVTFEFDELDIWGNQVLVARLKPADADSEKKLNRIVEDRAHLSLSFEQQFNVKMRTGYSPHVSLGYFANREYAELATSQIENWTRLVSKKVDNLAITFSSISLYCFTDMVTFFRKA